MRGEGTCTESPEEAQEHPDHCVHYRVRHDDFICCFCGDLFVGHLIPAGPHGRYQPRRERK